MRFFVGKTSPLGGTGEPVGHLKPDNWDDYGFKTAFGLRVRDAGDRWHDIGGVKVGRFGMASGQTPVPQVFETLPAEFVSLGQDASYYVNLRALPDELGSAVLIALRDMVADPVLFEHARMEPVVEHSLLRSVTVGAVLGQFRRIVRGGREKVEFSFAVPVGSESNGARMDFRVDPESLPPSNVHVLVGGNGVGKTRHLRALAVEALAGMHDAAEDAKAPSATSTDTPHTSWTRIVSVAFSAFDTLDGPHPGDPKRYVRVGLHDAEGVPKGQHTLAEEFGDSLELALRGERGDRWRRAITALSADPIIYDSALRELAFEPSASLVQRVREEFPAFSSGHKIVLLTMTSLVQTLEERSLVLVDEPESHLHPPLLSAFIRALSQLLVECNAAAVVATHSPVVLQEVPRTCVWKLRRSGAHVVAERPSMETFGENVGVLTHEVFGLEVTHSGFHTMLSQMVEEGRGYDEIVAAFQGALGSEARAQVRALMAAR